jgi:cobalt-zinc-cadmium efflux system outer membrane protein
MAHGNSSRSGRPKGLIFLLAALITGCASYQPEPLSPADRAAAIGARTLDNPRLLNFIALEHGGAPDGKRWDLADLTLAALYYHPDLDIARAKLDAAAAGATTAAQVPNPSLSFEDLAYNATAGTWTVAPVINFLIETFGKREYRTKQAQALVEAARSGLATASWQVRGGVRNALLNLWAAQRRLALLTQRFDLQDQLAALLEHRFAAGQASALDVARERIARNQISLAVHDAQRQAVDGRTQLAAAIGIPLRAFDGLDISFGAFEEPEQPLPDTGALQRQALVGRSDVQALLAEYAAAESAVALEVANQYPNITLSPGIGYDAGDNVYRLLPAADLPIFNQNQGPIAQARARRELAAARFTALQTQIIDAIDGAAASYRAASETLATADRLATDEEQRAQRILQSFQAGQVDRPTLLTAQIERMAADQSRFDVMVQQRQALGALEDALQHPFYEPDAAFFVPQTNPRLGPEPPR